MVKPHDLIARGFVRISEIEVPAGTPQHFAVRFGDRSGLLGRVDRVVGDQDEVSAAGDHSGQLGEESAVIGEMLQHQRYHRGIERVRSKRCEVGERHPHDGPMRHGALQQLDGDVDSDRSRAVLFEGLHHAPLTAANVQYPAS